MPILLQHNALLSPSGIPELRVEKPFAMEMGQKINGHVHLHI